jgi:hypothetical protein
MGQYAQYIIDFIPGREYYCPVIAVLSGSGLSEACRTWVKSAANQSG